MADLGIKEYAYLGMIIALLAGFGWWSYHERNEQRVADAAKETAALAREASHVKQVEDAANVQLSKLQSQLDVALTAPIKPTVVVRMCQPAAASTPADPAAAATAPSDAASGPSSGVGNADQEPDIAPATEQILARDRAVINYLQGYIRTCQQAGVCQKEVSP